MRIYYKMIRILAIVLLVMSMMDLLIELNLYSVFHNTDNEIIKHIQVPWGVCVKDAIGVIGAILGLIMYQKGKYIRWIMAAETMLLIAAVPIIIVTLPGNIGNEIDGIIDFVFIPMGLLVYAMSQLGRILKVWKRLEARPPMTQNIKLRNFDQWFNELDDSPTVALSEEVAATIESLLNRCEPAPMILSVRCAEPLTASEKEIMKDTFRFYYEGEEHMLFDRLNEQFLHAIFMTTVSLICITICKRFALADPNSIVLDILNTFACFTFWEICNTYYTRRKHFTKLEQVKISKDAEIRFAE